MARKPLKTPYGLCLIDNCVTCTFREERLFCNVSDEALQAFDRMKYTAVYPAGATLFVEDQEPLSVFVLCSGKIKLYTTSRDGKILITQLLLPGDVLGASAVISGRPHVATAETLEPCHVKVVRRGDFLSLLDKYGELAMRVAQLLSNACHTAHDQARTIGLAASVEERLVQFLLDCGAREGKPLEQGIRMQIGLTHQEIGQVIGSTRETVSRTLTQLKRKHLIEVRGATILIPDVGALRAIVHR